jgi:hypothetical protein
LYQVKFLIVLALVERLSFFRTLESFRGWRDPIYRYLSLRSQMLDFLNNRGLVKCNNRISTLSVSICKAHPESIHEVFLKFGLNSNLDCGLLIASSAGLQRHLHGYRGRRTDQRISFPFSVVGDFLTLEKLKTRLFILLMHDRTVHYLSGLLHQ